jgi:hypothetical protein
VSSVDLKCPRVVLVVWAEIWVLGGICRGLLLCGFPLSSFFPFSRRSWRMQQDQKVYLERSLKDSEESLREMIRQRVRTQ